MSGAVFNKYQIFNLFHSEPFESGHLEILVGFLDILTYGLLGVFSELLVQKGGFLEELGDHALGNTVNDILRFALLQCFLTTDLSLLFNHPGRYIIFVNRNG